MKSVWRFALALALEALTMTALIGALAYMGAYIWFGATA